MGDLANYLTAHFGWLAKASPWLKKLLNEQQNIQLESLRKEFQIPHDNFLMCIYMSIQLGTKIVERDYHLHKKMWPNKPEQDILRNLLSDEFSKDPDMAGSSIIEMEQSINEAMRQICTYRQLCNYIELRTYRSDPEYYNSTLAQQIDDIIAGQKTIRCPKCSTNLRVPYSYVTSRWSCPHCRTLLQVPNTFEFETAQSHRHGDNHGNGNRNCESNYPHTIINCPKCYQGLRIPNDKINAKITCPRCKNSFYWQNDEYEWHDK